jgi:predicted dehydrogenase
LTGLLVGYGSIGRRHLANLYGLGITDWAVVHTGRGTVPLDLPGPVRTYRNLIEALDHETPSFAVIANPSSLHLGAAVACAAAGCHLLVEKPLSDRLEGVAELEAAAAARGVRILVGFQFRYHPALARIGAILRSGVVGSPLDVTVVWAEHLPSWHPWEDWRRGYAARADLGGGVHHTICHPFDYLRLLFGDPVEVRASVTTDGPLGLGVPEAADVVVGFGGAFRARVHLDYWARPLMHRLVVVCADGTVEWDYPTGLLRTWTAATGAWLVEELPGIDDRNDLFVEEARHFLEVVGGRADPVCTLSDGVAAIAICQAVDRSVAEGSSVPVTEGSVVSGAGRLTGRAQGRG